MGAGGLLGRRRSSRCGAPLPRRRNHRWPRGEAGGTNDGANATVENHEALGDEARVVHEWRAVQFTRPAFSGPLAEDAADAVDWHQIAARRARLSPAARPAHRPLTPG